MNSEYKSRSSIFSCCTEIQLLQLTSNSHISALLHLQGKKMLLLGMCTAEHWHPSSKIARSPSKLREKCPKSQNFSKLLQDL